MGECILQCVYQKWMRLVTSFRVQHWVVVSRSKHVLFNKNDPNLSRAGIMASTSDRAFANSSNTRFPTDLWRSKYHFWSLFCLCLHQVTSFKTSFFVEWSFLGFGQAWHLDNLATLFKMKLLCGCLRQQYLKKSILRCTFGTKEEISVVDSIDGSFLGG